MNYYPWRALRSIRVSACRVCRLTVASLAGMAVFGAGLITPAASAANNGTGTATPATNGLTITCYSMDRVTVPPGFIGTFAISNYVRYLGPSNGVPVQLSVVGLPDGAVGTLDTGTWTGTNNSVVWLNLSLNNVAKGSYDFAISALGDPADSIPSNHLSFVLQVADIWNGSTNAAGMTSTYGSAWANWSEATNWLGGVPGPSDDVVFGILGGQTNFYSFTATTTNLLVNSIVPSDTEIASLRFSQTNTPFEYHNLQIGPNATLKVTGTNGFSVLQDYLNGLTIAGATISAAYVNISGQGSTLLVSNSAANFAVLVAGASGQVFSMTNLDNLVVDVKRVGFGDFELYPNYHNFNNDNNYGSQPRQFLGLVYLARTNSFHATYKDPNDYNVEYGRQYGITFGNVDFQGATSGPKVTLGQTNYFAADGVCLSHQNYSLSFFGFKPEWATNYPFALATNTQYAIFRGTNGGRMSMFAVADEGGTNWAQSNQKQTIDFGSYNGSVDILADRFILARDRTMIVSNQTPNIQGTMYVGAGNIDVNTAIFGYQEHSGKTNWPVNYLDYCQGNLTVSNGAVFKVNNSLTLGYTADTNPSGVAQQYNTKGTLTVRGGSTAMINTILVDPGLGLSTGNTITLSNGTLIVSNTLASASKALDTLSMAGGSTLALHIDGNRTDPYVYVTNLTTATGTNSYLQIAKISNLSSPLIPLISFSGTPPTLTLDMTKVQPLGGALTVNNSVVYLNLLTNTPKNLVWKGYVNGNWDQTTANWLDLATGLHTNFVAGDTIVFDDSATTTTISVVDSLLIPGSMLMTNITNPYIFTDGGGSVQGSATLSKWGGNSIEFDGSGTIGLSIHEGLLLGTGTVGPVSIAANAAATFYGNINGGVGCTGTATLYGTTVGAITLVGPSGILTNFGTIQGNFSFGTNTLLYNGHSINTGTFSPTVSTNATLINAGSWTGRGLDIQGTLKDMGGNGFTMDLALTIDAGGTFIPGGDGLGTTTVGATSYCPTTPCYPGRLVLGNNSTNIFKVDLSDPGSPLNASVNPFYLDLGNNQGTYAANGCILVLTNIGTGTFAAGQSFKLFGPSGTPVDSAGTNHTFPAKILPVLSGLGLAWDTRQLATSTNYSLTSQLGLLGIISVPNTPTNVAYNPTWGFTYTYKTNVDNTTTPPTTNVNVASTNRAIIVDLQWPTNYQGYSLQQQSGDITNGLRMYATNWTTVYGTWWTNEIIFTNTIPTNGTGGVQFYRLSNP
jgi:hypothetical protein